LPLLAYLEHLIKNIFQHGGYNQASNEMHRGGHNYVIFPSTVSHFNQIPFSLLLPKPVLWSSPPLLCLLLQARFEGVDCPVVCAAMEVVGLYVSWIDISLVANQSFIR